MKSNGKNSVDGTLLSWLQIIPELQESDGDLGTAVQLCGQYMDMLKMNENFPLKEGEMNENFFRSPSIKLQLIKSS